MSDINKYTPVILESPFAGDVYKNLMYLRACMHDSLMRNEAPFASHGLYTQTGVLDDHLEEERMAGIHAGFAWRQLASKTVVYQDLGISKGMQYGIQHATDAGHEIVYRKLSSTLLRNIEACVYITNGKVGKLLF